MHPYNISPLTLILLAVYAVSAVLIVCIWRKPNQLYKKVLLTLGILLFLAAATGAAYYIALQAISILDIPL